MTTPEPQESIAIVGMAGRFPKARNLEEFWRNLREGRECISFFKDEPLQWLPIEHPPRPDDPRYVRARGVLERAEWFDPAFFGMNPKEAEMMDPQHRVFLECAWEALENAGCNPETYDGLIGVFAGASMNTYLLTNLMTNRDLIADFGMFSAMIMNDGDFVPTRVSYKLNLRGPSINVQTACSTSLVAVCLAAQSLLGYRCDVALAGGVSITFPPNRGQFHLEGGILSKDGHCRTFDAQASGTVLGDGAGVVVLKRLSDALADGDRICAVIKGTAINNDGSVKIGYTAPSVDGQAEVIAMAHAEAGFAPETISYIEAHGTGTPLGDPIEIAGLAKAFGLGGERGQFCAVGSVKSNLGHLDIGAGVAGLIKTVLALEHGEIPPSLHFEKPNPKIDLANSPFFINRTLRPWMRNGAPRRAGVSSFGIGGTNAHVAIEEPPALEPTSASRKLQLLLLSAKTPTALDAMTDNLAAHLEGKGRETGDRGQGTGSRGQELADVAFTLQTGRKVFARRRAVVCENAADAVQALRSRDPKRLITGGSDGAAPSVAFMFPGQGAQAVNMARELYEADADFRAQVDRCCEILRPKLGLDLRSIMFPELCVGAPGNAELQPAAVKEAGGTPALLFANHAASSPASPEAGCERLTRTEFAQPAMFVIEYALAQLWMGWGIRPAAMIGHSLGEYVAACIAGVMSLDDALALVAERARLMQAQPPGAMLAIRLPEQQVLELLHSNLALAAVNAPGLCVVSGPFDVIEAAEKRLAAGAIPSKRLATSHAFHSAMMEPALPPLTEFVRRMKLHPPTIPWVSNVTGTWITAAEATNAEYWATHLRRAVRFADGVGELVNAGHRVLLEVGPGQTLAGLARQHPAAGGGAATIVATLGHGKDNAPDLASMLHALGALWVAGVTPDWRGGFYRNERRRVVGLPTYPFERKRYWIEPGIGFDGLAQSFVVPPSGGKIESIPPEGGTANTEAAAGINGVEHSSPSTLATLRKLFQELSGIDLSAAGPEETFYQLGFDSLFLTQASLAVAKRFGVDVSFRQLREDFVTLAKLAAHIDESGQMTGGRGRETGDRARETGDTGQEPAVTACPSSPVPRPQFPVSCHLPLTDAQREMWYASQMGTSVSSAYNEESTLRLRGPLDVSAVQRALQTLVSRHEALRTTFSATGDVQIIAPALEIKLPVHDYSSSNAAVREARAIGCADEEVERPFDLVAGPLFRAALIKIEPERHFLVLVVHHIICDGWSLGTLVRELCELYAAEMEHRAATLPEPLSFSGYTERQAAERTQPAFAAAEAYWKNQFADGVPVLELPTDRPRPSKRTYAGNFVLHTVPPEITRAIRRLGAERDCTMFTTLLAAFNVLLHRLSGQDDLVVGVPSASQVMGGLGNLVGHFANLLPMRSRMHGARRFSDYLVDVRRQLADAMDHWRYPFTTLVHQLKIARHANRMPLANVVFNSSRLRGRLRFGPLEVEATVSPKRFVNFDLNFNFAANEDTISLGCYYSTELFDEQTIARWIGHFEMLLRGITANPDTAVGELPLLTAKQRDTMVRAWNDTAAAYPRHECVHALALEQARRTPDAIALVHGDAHLSYAELDRRAAELAGRLRALGVGADVPVAICLERSFDMIVAVLAVLRAGGAYLPLDPGYPADRLAFMLEDSGAPVLLTQASRRRALPAHDAQVICLDEAVARASGPCSENLHGQDARATPENLAYIIYTSGSTGKPKGVAMPHRALTNLITWQQRNSRIGVSGRTLQFASLSFDVSFQEIFSTLATGGTLVLVDDELRRDARALWELIVGERVERVFLPFVALQQLAEAFRPGDAETAVLREVITAGEPLQITPKITAMFTALRDCTLHNQYGPTEAHVVTAFTLPGTVRAWEARPPIGRPIANAEIYLLDPRGEPVPVGVPGELFIGGDCLARGYINRPELTAEKFTPHPFVAPGANPECHLLNDTATVILPRESGECHLTDDTHGGGAAGAGRRLYRTGDLARYRADGNIEFLGRIDHQVKLNGYRIELGEIEAVLSQHPAVGECAVMVRTDQADNRRLVAYFVAAGGRAAPGSAELREHLQRRLPDYMIPTALIALEKLPLTPSGKIDRRALPAPEDDGAADAGPAPRTMAEELLADIWCDVLALEQVGIYANFFELGGHSLLATQVISRVHEALDIDLPLARFFAAPTIAELAPVIEELLVLDIKATTEAEPAPAEEPALVSTKS